MTRTYCFGHVFGTGCFFVCLDKFASTTLTIPTMAQSYGFRQQLTLTLYMYLPIRMSCSCECANSVIMAKACFLMEYLFWSLLLKYCIPSGHQALKQCGTDAYTVDEVHAGCEEREEWRGFLINKIVDL
jgi:hypothetical protein